MLRMMGRRAVNMMYIGALMKGDKRAQYTPLVYYSGCASLHRMILSAAAPDREAVKLLFVLIITAHGSSASCACVASTASTPTC